MGLLFSGGVDSLASYIRHREKKPNLIMIWGADIPISQEGFWRKLGLLMKTSRERKA